MAFKRSYIFQWHIRDVYKFQWYRRNFLWWKEGALEHTKELKWDTGTVEIILFCIISSKHSPLVAEVTGAVKYTRSYLDPAK